MLTINYVGHAGLLVETADCRIAFDPWTEGPAYAESWYIFPKPCNAEILDKADHIVLSHGHEDHFHGPTLEKLPNSATVWIPFSWYGGSESYLQELGFSDIREAANFKRRQLGPDTFITFVCNNLDSAIVIEHDGQVVVNVNDALHAAHHRIIDMFVQAILKRWPKIDTVLCGFGGASYFPNTVHADGKDDLEIGRLREQLFAHNFCRIVDALAPKVAVPFAADFALLEPAKRWIAQVRFPRERLPAYFAEHFPRSSTRIELMYPADRLENNALVAESPYREQLQQSGQHSAGLDHLIDQQYADEIQQKDSAETLGEDKVTGLVEGLHTVIKARRERFSPEQLASLSLALEVTDLPEPRCFDIRVSGESVSIERVERSAEDTNISLSAPLRIFESCFAHDWGGEAITIGYGAEIQIHDRSMLQAKLDHLAIDLLTYLPSASRQLRKEPLRGMRYMLTNPLSMKWALDRFTKRHQSEASIYDQNYWLTRSKCDICRLCDLPLLDDNALIGHGEDPSLAAVTQDVRAE